MPLQKPFSFTSNTDCKFTIYGESPEQALMSHLCTCTKVVGHQLSSAEAKNPNVIIMIAPDEFLRYFDSFEAIAETAWNSISASKEPEKFVFKLNNGDTIPVDGASRKEALMNHLIEKTKEVGHRISFEEAENPDFIVMVEQSEFVLPFGSFDKAATKAWQRACEDK